MLWSLVRSFSSLRSLRNPSLRRCAPRSLVLLEASLDQMKEYIRSEASAYYSVLDTLCPVMGSELQPIAECDYWILRFEQPFGRGGYAVSLYVQSLNNAALQSQPNNDWNAYRLSFLTEPVRDDLTLLSSSICSRLAFKGWSIGPSR